MDLSNGCKLAKGIAKISVFKHEHVTHSKQILRAEKYSDSGTVSMEQSEVKWFAIVIVR